MSLLARSDFPNAFEFVFQGFSFQSNERMKAELIKTFFLKKMGQTRPLFHLFSVFSNKQNNFFNKSMCKNFMSIQYTVPGFEPTTFGT